MRRYKQAWHRGCRLVVSVALMFVLSAAVAGADVGDGAASEAGAPSSVSEGASGEGLRVVVRDFTMGRRVVSWWKHLEWGDEFFPDRIIPELVRGDLVKSPRWSVLERTGTGIDKREYNLGASGAVEASSAIQEGEALGAEYEIRGRVIDFNLIDTGTDFSVGVLGFGLAKDGNGKVRVSVEACIVDTATSQIVATASSCHEAEVKDGGFAVAYSAAVAQKVGGELPSSALGDCMRLVAADLSKAFCTCELRKTVELPHYSGTVIAVDDGAVFITLDGELRAKRGVILKVKRMKETVDPRTGAKKTVKVTIGRVRIASVADTYECKILDAECEPQEGDVVEAY